MTVSINGTTGVTTPKVTLLGAGSVALNAGASGSWTLTLPTSAGTDGQVLTTDGAGNTSWIAGGGGITVGTTTITSGTSGAIPFNNAGVYGEDATQLFWNNANNQLLVGGNTAVGLNKFQLINSDALIYGLTVGRGSGSGATNTVVGAGALATNITGTRNTAIGASALAANRADFNTAIGYTAMAATTTGNGNVAVGDGALSVNTIGNSNIAVGSSALSSNTLGSYNSAIGFNCLAANTTGINNTALGNRALASCAIYSNNTAVGRDALFLNTLGSDNASFGYNAARETATNNNAVFGAHALEFNTVGGNNTIIGCNAGDAINSSNNTLVGRYTGFGAPVNGTGSGFVVLSDGLGNVRFATNASGALSFDGASYGTAGQVLQSNGNAAVPTWVTPSSGIEVGVTTITSGTAGSIPYNNGTVYSEDNAYLFWDETNYRLGINTNTPTNALTVAGDDALINGITAGRGAGQNSLNTVFGAGALATNSGSNNTAFGSNALNNSTSATGSNAAFGSSALATNAGSGNTGIGHRALVNCTGNRNTAVGRLAMSFATVTGIENTALGISALGFLTSGSYNTALGKSAGFDITTGSYNTIIGAYDAAGAPIFGTGNNYVVLSDGAGNVPVFWDGLTGNQICNGPVVTQGYTVAGLAGITPITGMRVHVTDALAPTFLTTVVGGGAIKCPVFYNGANWVAG